MIHYHGTPVGGPKQDTIRLVPFTYQDDIGPVAEACQSFVFDNGAFTAWKKGRSIDFDAYVRWVEVWHRHPGLDWAIIPDVIDGDEKDNDALLVEWPRHLPGVPVYHLHESLDRLIRLSETWPIVALGSSGKWPTPGAVGWWRRMGEVMDAVCDEDGRPRVRLHGLRMLDPDIFTRLPLASADSTNAARNSGSTQRFGMYCPPTVAQRAAVIADRIESYNSPAVWAGSVRQEALTLYPG